MSEINILEQRYVPVKPKVLANEQIEVYIPTAGYSKPGAASFDPLSFVITPEGQVKSRRPVSTRNVVDFTIDSATGIGRIYYDDGSIEELQFPIVTDGQFKKIGLITTIELTEQSFVTMYDKTFAAFSTGFSNNKYLAFVESYGSEYYITEDQGEQGSNRQGVYTVPDTLFKGDDGSILYEVSDASEIVNFNGRLILLGGDIFTDNNVISISYDAVNKIMRVTKSDLSVDSIKIVSEEKFNDYATLEYAHRINDRFIDYATINYVDNLVNNKVGNAYISRGVTIFNNLPEESLLSGWVNSVWIIRDEFTIPDGDTRFLFEQQGKTYPAGTNVVAAELRGVYFLDIIGSVVGSANCFEKTEFDKIYSTVDTIITTDDGIDVLYSYNGYQPVITLPIRGVDGINIDVNESNDFIEIKLDEVYAGTKEVLITSPETATQGTLTSSELQSLLVNDGNYILFNNERYILADKHDDEGYRIYSHLGFDNVSNFFNKYITVNVNNSTWVLTETSYIKPTDRATKDKAGPVKLFGTGILMNGNGQLYLDGINDVIIKKRNSEELDTLYTNVNPFKFDDILVASLTSNKNTLSEDSTDESGNVVEGEKTMVCEWIGALKKNTDTFVSSNTTDVSVYCVDQNGNQVMQKAYGGVISNTIVRRLGDNIQVPEHNVSYYAINKGQADKSYVAKSTTDNSIYGVGEGGSQVMWNFNATPLPNMPVKRNYLGHINIPNDTEPDAGNAVRRDWVEAKITELQAQIDALK